MAEAPAPGIQTEAAPDPGFQAETATADEPKDLNLRTSADTGEGKEVQPQGYSVSAPPQETREDDKALQIEVDEDVVSGERPRARTILIAVDESEHTMYTLRYTLANIATREDTLVLLNAYPDVEQYLSGYEPPNWVKEVQDKYKTKSEGLLDKISKPFQQLKMKFTKQSSQGDARNALQDAVHTIHPDLIIVGSHGYGMVKRTLLGSVSDYAAHHLDAPVLIVKTPVSKEASGAHEIVSGMEKLGHTTAPAAA